jgi:hypothetical protein
MKNLEPEIVAFHCQQAKIENERTSQLSKSMRRNLNVNLKTNKPWQL